MPRAVVLLIGLVVGVLVAVAGILGARVAISSTSLGVTERTLACGTESGADSGTDSGTDSDAAGSDAAEVCVIRLSRPELILVPGRREIQVRWSDAPRALYAEDPFGGHVDDDELEIDLDDGVIVQGPAYALSWSADEVASLLTD
ncbi:hypothetical protein FE697_011135 [Mumia zhuanghuii]|uniref:DUF4340 domain-containing protein n=2 Tax=Mumia TaxID=1546255 RepID=A0ABW1QGL5_9ACTN|nr:MULTISPECIES: hypothetical protein [Mumia]KAA1422719.1 hypothetical protein FE697_011135 [Mumia zhuanghuii]